jgi:aspartyl-tRNA(Asn)/glutamyl-tRNA(Gln) amidotransferase subunit A
MRRERTVVEHVEATLARIAAAEPELGAFVTVAGDEVRGAAADADAAIRTLGPAAWLGRPLLGVTVAVKDLIRTADLPTGRGSARPDDGPRADAPSVARLRAAGALVVGKTTTSEGGWSASTVGRVAPPTANPWAPDRSAGGSSGGSAAAVAAGLCDAALGTDGAGSIRIPAAFCGVVGFKPSYGRVPYVPTCADRLAHVGPLTTGVADAAELMTVIAGPHRDDPDSAVAAVPVPPPDRPLRIGWLEFPGTTKAVRDTSERIWPALRSHHVEPVETPFPDPYPALVDIIAAAEAAGTAEADEPLCDPDRLAVVRYGRTVTGADVLRAEAARTALRVRLAAVFERYDLLAMATVPIEPFARTAIGPRWATGLSWLAWAPAAYPFNLTGQPALSLPVGNTDAGLPVGVQLVGPPGADDLVLSVAAAVEARRGPLPARPLPEKVV